MLVFALNVSTSEATSNMNRYIVILAGMLLILQLEVFALLLLDKQNLQIWRAQSDLNASIIDAVNSCL